MKWNAFLLVKESFSKTKELILPFDFMKWLKIGFIGIMSNFKVGGGGGSGNGSGYSSSRGSQTTGRFLQDVNIPSPLGYLIAGGIVVFALLYLLFSYLRGVFTFIYLNTLEKKDTAIVNNFKRFNQLGISFFKFKMIFDVIMLLIFAVVISPLLYIVITNWSTLFSNYKELFTPMNIVILVICIFLLIIVAIIRGIFWSLVMNFSVVHMYYKKTIFSNSFFLTFGKMKKQLVEIIVFILARIVFSICAGILIFLAVVLLLIPFGLVILLFILPGIFYTPLLPLGIAVGVVLFICFIICCIALNTPFLSFMTYHSILSYKEFIK